MPAQPNRRSLRAMRTRCCRHEPLEQRNLLAAESVPISASATVHRNDDHIVVDDGSSTLLDVPIGDLDTLTLNGNQADNVVTLDFRDGDVIPAGGIEFDGSDGDDTLLIVGAVELDVRSVGRVMATNVESLDLLDPETQIVTLDATAVRSISPQGTLVYYGGNEDDLIFADARQWRMTAPTTMFGEFAQTATNLTTGEIIQARVTSHFKNLIVASDVNNDGDVSTLDAVNVVNELVARRVSSGEDGHVVDPSTLVPFPGFYPDQSGDNTVSALDAVRVINEIARQQSAGELLNVAITSDPGVQQNPSVAVNPIDPDHVVVAYMDYSLVDTGYAGIGVSVSTDGGRSFTTSSIPVPEEFAEGAANPIAKFNDSGQVYVSYMAATFLAEKPHLTNGDFFDPALGASPREFGVRANNGVFVARSDDGGLSWNESSAVVSHLYDGENEVFFEVIPDLAIDNFAQLPDGQSNPNHGNLYATWTRIYPSGQFPGEPDASGGTELFIAVSQDAGQTWTTRTRDIEGNEVSVFDHALDNTGRGVPPGLGFEDQARVFVGPEGEIYMGNFDAGSFAVHLSRDAGVSFVGPNAENQERFVFNNLEFAGVGSDGLPGNQFRTHAQRGLAADPMRPGHVYAVESVSIEAGDGSTIDPAEIIVKRSTDFGQSWESIQMVGQHPADDVAPGPFGVPVNDDNFANSATASSPDEVTSGQAIPRLAVADDGTIGVIWYDTRRDPENHLLDVFGSISTDGGETFSPNFRLTDVSFDADQGVFINAAGGDEFYLGDFIGLSLAGNVAYAAWTDTRGGNQDIVLRKFQLDAPPEAPNDRFEPNDTPDLSNSPTMLGRVVQRVLPKLSVTPGDQDFFLLETAATGELIATARFEGDPPTDTNSLLLELYDQTGTSLLATGVGLLDAEGKTIGKQLSFPSDTGDQFQVRVVGAGSDTVGYKLQLQSLTADLGSRAFTSVAGSLAEGGGALYRVVAPASGSIDVQLTGGGNVSGDLSVQVLDAETLKVLAVGQTLPPVPTTATSAEPNDAIGQANNTGLSGLGRVTIDSTIGDGDFGGSSGDFDFYSFDAGPNTLITVDVNVSAIGSQLDSLVALYDSSGEALQVVDGAGPGSDEALTFSTDKADTYSVAVLGWESFPPSDPLTPGTGAGAGGVGDFRMTITTEAVGPGAVKQVSLPARSDDTLLLLVSGEGASGNFTLNFTNLDQFTIPETESLLFPAGDGPSALDIGDFNLDGNLDVVVSNGLSDTVSVLLGAGDGTLLAPRQFTIGAFRTPNPLIPPTVVYGRDVQIAEFNGDSLPDIVVTNFDSSDISVLLGRGDGSFEPQRRFDATSTPQALDVGDLDNDGNLDVLVADTTDSLPRINVAVLMGRGDGTFRPLPTFQLESGIFIPQRGPLLVDMNDDTILDLVIGGDIEPGIEVLLGNGDGTFTLLGRFDSVDQAPDLAVADINEDGFNDVIAPGSSTSTVSVLFGNGDGTLRAPLDLPLVGQSMVDVEVVDFGSELVGPDGSKILGPRDGKKDLVVVASGVTAFISPIGGPEIIVIPAIFDDQNQFVGFGEPQTIAEPDLPLDVDVGDFDNDGLDDLAVTDRNGVLLVFGDPPSVATNDTIATARKLGTVVHFVDQTQTIVPDRKDAFYKFTVPTEVVTDADQVIDVSLLFEATEGPGLDAELRDASGNLLGSGDRFRVRARQGEELSLHVFGLNDGNPGYGVFTPVINVLPQVVSVESQALLPGNGENPGGPTTNIVLTFQGDRLDRDAAEDAANYTITSFGADRLFGTADDTQVPIADIVYSPSTNVDISSGRTFPTAVRQTVTLLFDDALPAGSYRIESSGVETEAFNEQEADLLADTQTFGRHPLVSLADGQIDDQISVTAIDLVLASGDLGDVDAVFNAGTRFLTQLHDDLASVLDATLTELGDAPQVTDEILNQIVARLVPGVGERGARDVALMALFIDPATIDIEDQDGEIVASYNVGSQTVINETCYVEVGGNIEVIVCYVVDQFSDFFDLKVSDIPATARGGIVLIGSGSETVQNITPDLRDGYSSGSSSVDFMIQFP